MAHIASPPVLPGALPLAAARAILVVVHGGREQRIAELRAVVYGREPDPEAIAELKALLAAERADHIPARATAGGEGVAWRKPVPQRLPVGFRVLAAALLAPLLLAVTAGSPDDPAVPPMDEPLAIDAELLRSAFATNCVGCDSADEALALLAPPPVPPLGAVRRTVTMDPETGRVLSESVVFDSPW